MHYYFTRKPLISCRFAVMGAIINSDLINNSYKLNKLLNIDPILKNRAYKQINYELKELIAKNINYDYKNSVILDPFAGSGMIPFEALRLGLNVVAIDYNSVAYLIMKGTLEYPLKYGNIKNDISGNFKLCEDLDYHSKNIFKKMYTEFGLLYPKHNNLNIRSYIHAWVVKCPVCGKETPLVNNWILDSKRKIRLNYEVIDGNIIYKIVKDNIALEGNIKRGNATCLLCSSKIDNENILKDIFKNEKETILAVYLEDRTFELPNKEDFKALNKAEELLKNNLDTLSKYIPSEKIADDERALPVKKYLEFWYRLFTPRQRLILANYVKNINMIMDELRKENEEYAVVIGVYLSMILAKLLSRNSRCNYWDSSMLAIGHALANRGLSMMWNHAEANPFVKSSGSIESSMKDVMEGLKFACNELNQIYLNNTTIKPTIEIHQASILTYQSNIKYKYIITDPPYYDDVPYPEVLQFFQVWHYKTVGNFLKIPPIPSINEELSVNPYRTKKMYEDRLQIAINKLYNLLEDDGILVLFYAHKSINGWRYLLEALRKTGFCVTSTITLMTESENSVIAKDKSSIFHSLLISARKRREDKKISLLDLEDEIKLKMENRYDDLEKTYGQDRMNLMVAASGLVIETVSNYSEITSFTTNIADYALEIGQKFLIEIFAKKSLNVDKVDPKTMLYIWFRHSLNDEIDFSEFNQTLKVTGASEENIGDLVEKGKDRSKIRLLDFTERGSLEIDGMEPLVAQSVIDAAHLTLRAYLRGGISIAKETITSSPYGSKTILNTIEALANISGTKPNYKEGEICSKFLDDWNNIQGKPKKTYMDDYSKKKTRG